MMRTVLAYIMREIDGELHVQQACVGCAEKLESLGMLRVEKVTPLPGDTRRVDYEIVAPYTLEECRAAIKGEPHDH